MKSKILAIALVTIGFTAHANVSLVWSTNLAEIVTADWEYAEIKEFNDGSVAILSWTDPHHLLVFSGNGELVYSDFIEGTSEFGYGAMFTGSSSCPSRFFVRLNTDDNERSLNVYEKTGETYVVTNLFSASTAFSLNDQYIGSRGNNLYAIDNTILKKYQFSVSPTYLSGTTSMGVSNNNFVISWNTEPDVLYQIQGSSNLTNWNDIGLPITGTGEPINWANSLSPSNSFFRIIVE